METENEYIKNLVEEESQKYSEEKLENKLDNISQSVEKINELDQEEHSCVIKNMIKSEMRNILEELPKNVKVLQRSNRLYVSRAKEEDKIIEVWYERDLAQYVTELNKLFVSKALDIK